MKRSANNSTVSALILSLLSGLGAAFVLFVCRADADEILSNRELALTGEAAMISFLLSFLISRKFSPKTCLLTFFSTLMAAAALNFAFPGLMEIPLLFPAENSVTVAEIGEGASLSLRWAYWIQPGAPDADMLLNEPYRDISFPQLERSGNWEERDEGMVPVTGGNQTAIGISRKLRTHPAVFCFTAEGGNVTLKPSGTDKPLHITPEMTAGQPYRIILANGLLPAAAGNILQIFLWGCTLYPLGICFILLCSRASALHGSRKTALILLCSFLLPCLVLLLLCASLRITPFGDKTFLINDMWGEYAEYMAYFRSVLSGKNDLFYSFSKSLGDDLPSLLAFYVINPLNWIVCLFPPERLPLVITFLVIVRFGICGLTAAIYFTKQRKCGWSALLFSSCYALMSFSVVNAENTNLRESAMLLPLVILGLERLIDGQSIRTYIWSLAAAVFLNYYSGYQICIFAAIYFIFYFFRRVREVSFFRTLVRFGFASLMAVGITAFLLFPVVLQLRNGPKAAGSENFGLFLNMPWNALAGKLLASAYDVGQISVGYPSLYAGLVCVVLLPLYFTNRKIGGREKIFTAGLLLVCVMVMQLNPMNLALHGFSAPLWWPYRYSFIICFFLVLTAQESYAQRNGWGINGFIAAALFCGLILWLSAGGRYSWLNADTLKMNLILLTALLLLFAFTFRGPITALRALLGLLSILELTLDAAHILTINTAYERSGTVSEYVSYYTQNKPLFDWIREEDDGFYRLEKSYFRTPNEAMVYDYHGISHYSSTLNNNVLSFLKKTGFRIQPPYRVIYWEGSDAAMDSLLGIKYLLTGPYLAKPYEPVHSEGEITVYRNPLALPLMFTASPEVLDTVIDQELEGFELQNRIFSALTGENREIFVPLSVSAPQLENLVPDKTMGNGSCYRKESDAPASLVWDVQAMSPDIVYAFFPTEILHPAAISLDEEPFREYYDNNSYHILSVGAFEPGKVFRFGMSPHGERLCLNDTQFFHENRAALEEAVRILRNDETDLRKVSGSLLKGSFTASQGKVLFFSIPYDRGWTIRIDGQKTEVYQVFDTFMAVEAPAGEHSIELRFVPSGFVPGVIVSLLSAAAAVICGRREKHI